MGNEQRALFAYHKLLFSAHSVTACSKYSGLDSLQISSNKYAVNLRTSYLTHITHVTKWTGPRNVPLNGRSLNTLATGWDIYSSIDWHLLHGTVLCDLCSINMVTRIYAQSSTLLIAR